MKKKVAARFDLRKNRIAKEIEFGAMDYLYVSDTDLGFKEALERSSEVCLTSPIIEIMKKINPGNPGIPMGDFLHAVLKDFGSENSRMATERLLKNTKEYLLEMLDE